MIFNIHLEVPPVNGEGGVSGFEESVGMGGEFLGFYCKLGVLILCHLKLSEKHCEVLLISSLCGGETGSPGGHCGAVV